MNYWEYIFIFAIVGGGLIFGLIESIKHLPKKRIEKELSELIKTNGLVHFTKPENIKAIKSQGLIPGKELTVFERGRVWFYINDEEKLKLAKEKIRVTRPESTAMLVLTGFTDEEISKMRYRPNDGAVTFKGRVSPEKISDMVDFDKWFLYEKSVYRKKKRRKKLFAKNQE